MTRRSLIRSGLAAALATCSQTGRTHAYEEGGATDWYMPEEGASHKRTWMAFGPSVEIWGPEFVDRARADLATLARTIARFEPVSMLVRPSEMELARELVGDAIVELVPVALDDLWIRDTGPVFVRHPRGGKAGVDLNFNGWGDKQAHHADAKIATYVSRRADVPVLKANVVAEGGGIEVDGEGTAILTESCFINDNRNPELDKLAIEHALADLFGLYKVIWLPGLRGQDITDGHTDFYVRFVRPGVVVAAVDSDPDSPNHAVTKQHLAILKEATDALERPIKVIELENPTSFRGEELSEDFAASYLGFYVCNGAVIAQQFGDEMTDLAVKKILTSEFPKRELVQLDMDGIAAGGGSIHCATQQEPKAR
ncbi:MAG: agmatine deiminase family protein [Chromatiales bacterium]|nr:agmatine deiminase family protein [Chromatiales bacterium]